MFSVQTLGTAEPVGRNYDHYKDSRLLTSITNQQNKSTTELIILSSKVKVCI